MNAALFERANWLAVSLTFCLSICLLNAAFADPDLPDFHVEEHEKDSIHPIQRLEMTVGTSRILSIDEEIPRVHVDYQAMLKVVPLDPKRVKVSAVKRGATHLALWGKSGEVRAVLIVARAEGEEPASLDALQIGFIRDRDTWAALRHPNDKQNPHAAAEKELTGKWIVRNVIRDGEKHPAQLGREIGDVITMEIQAGRFGFG